MSRAAVAGASPMGSQTLMWWGEWKCSAAPLGARPEQRCFYCATLDVTPTDRTGKRNVIRLSKQTGRTAGLLELNNLSKYRDHTVWLTVRAIASQPYETFFSMPLVLLKRGQRRLCKKYSSRVCDFMRKQTELPLTRELFSLMSSGGLPITSVRNGNVDFD